jgi:NAD(P)H-hydrate epimerase
MASQVRTTLSVDVIRAIDRLAIERFGFSSLVLMENAGRGAAEQIQLDYPEATSVVIACGKGNNGGDGYVIARHLAIAGWKVSCLALAPSNECSADCRVNREIIKSTGAASVIETASTSIGELETIVAKADLVIDAILGTGNSGEPRGEAARLIAVLGDSSKPCVAIDIPSGCDARTGESATRHIVANQTLTFVARKLGFDNPAASPSLGRVTVIGIGIPDKVIEAAIALS